jgi:hypothetical protein
MNEKSAGIVARKVAEYTGTLQGDPGLIEKLVFGIPNLFLERVSRGGRQKRHCFNALS